MTARLLAALLAVALIFVARPAAADALDHIEPRFTAGSDEIRSRCDRLVQDTAARRHGATHSEPAAAITSCLDLVRALTNLDEHDAGSLDERADDNRHRQLLASYLAMRITAPLVTAAAKSEPASAVETLYQTTGSDLHARLDAHGLSGSSLSTIVSADIVRADPGGYKGQTATAPNQGLTTMRLTASVETDHVAIGSGWDVSLDVDAGWQPLFVMVKSPPAPGVTPAYVSGLSLTTGPRIAHASRTTEIAATGYFGAARLPDTTFMVGSGNDEHSVEVAANDIAEWALALGGGLDFRWYVREVWQTHLTNLTLLPLLHVYGGLTHDQRFRREGDLEPYDDPTGRVYFGFDVHPFRVDLRQSRGSTPLLTFGGGFQFETALRTNERLPSGYKAFVSGRIDLMAMSRRSAHR